MFQPQSPHFIHKPRCLKHDHAFPCQYLCLRHPFIPPLKHTHGLKSQIWCFSHTLQLVRARAKARKQRFFAPGDAAARAGAKKGRLIALASAGARVWRLGERGPIIYREQLRIHERSHAHFAHDDFQIVNGRPVKTASRKGRIREINRRSPVYFIRFRPLVLHKRYDFFLQGQCQYAADIGWRQGAKPKLLSILPRTYPLFQRHLP